MKPLREGSLPSNLGWVVHLALAGPKQLNRRLCQLCPRPVLPLVEVGIDVVVPACCPPEAELLLVWGGWPPPSLAVGMLVVFYVGTKPQLRSADHDKSLDEVDWFRINLLLIEHNK